ncbi:MAG: permease-like cell division protein FtsX [Sulfuricella sp.]|nr:permease-like cell division protein FtsX [Sulfuricella sp.]
MSVWLIQHRAALAGVLRHFARTPFASLLTALVIGVALSLPAGLYSLLVNIQGLANHAQGEPLITVVLTATANAEAINDLQAKLRKREDIAEFTFIPRDQALQELNRSAGVGDVTAGLDKNPLPDVITVRPASTDAPAITKLGEELRKLPKVETVLLDEAWVKRLHAMLQLGREGVTLLAVLLGFALVVIIGNTIRLQILSQREEIEVSSLIGATDAFVRRPFLYHGAIQGGAGGAIAWLVVAGAFRLLNDAITRLAALYDLNFQLALPATPDILALLLFATVLGWMGAYLAVGRHLREIFS